MITGRIVISCAGRDKGRLLAVVGESEGYLLLADGKERRLEKPKLKNPKHISYIGQCLDEKVFINNKSLCRALRQCEIKEDF